MTRQREQRAWELRQQLWTQDRIAQELGIKQPTVCEMLKKIERRVFDQLNEEVTEAKGRQTSQLEYLASEAIDAWERSKLDAESVEETEEQTTIKAPGSAGGKELPAAVLRTKRTRKGQTGDPRHLDNVMKALTDIRAIWGMEAPKKSDVMSGGKSLINLVEIRRPPDADSNPAETPAEGDA